MKSSQEEKARSIAVDAHKGQTDKAGRPYIEHPRYVASVVSGDEAKAAAWLHDVVEDTEITLGDLSDAGISDAVIEAVGLLTHRDGVPYMDYIRSIKGNAIARQVKLADLRHNSDLGRLPNPTDGDRRRRERYREAIDMLSR